MNILLNKNVEFSYAGLFSSGSGMWTHPRREERSFEIIYVTEGKVFMREGNEDYCVAKGQLLLLRPGIEHCGFRESTGVSFYWLHFFLENGELPFEKQFFTSFDHAYLFKELLHYNNLPNVPDYLVNSVLIRILSEMYFQIQNSVDSSDRISEEIYEWIRLNASAGLTVETVAGHFGFSPDHITRLVKKIYGVGAKALINRFLLLRAKELLLNTNKYTKEIAYELGFESDNAFITFFKYHENVYPSYFRNEYCKIHMNNK